MGGRYVLVRMLADDDEERAATQWRVGQAIREIEGLGSLTMTSFELDEDESPVVLAKRLVRLDQVIGWDKAGLMLCSCPRSDCEAHA